MKKVKKLLSSLVMLVGLVNYGYGDDGVIKDGKVFCDGVHAIVRMCGYYGVLNKQVLSVKDVF